MSFVLFRSLLCLLNTLCAPALFSGKPEELPRKPLGQELPLSPSRGKPSSASGFPRAGLSLHIISHQPDSISPDQSPSKDPRDLDTVDDEEAPLPSPDPVIIHSQAPLTPDGSPLMGPPPYQPQQVRRQIAPHHQRTGQSWRMQIWSPQTTPM